MKGVITIEMETNDDWSQVTVTLKPDETAGNNFGFLMVAAEYMTAVAAMNSGAGFEKATELIVQGAMTYKTRIEKKLAEDHLLPAPPAAINYRYEVTCKVCGDHFILYTGTNIDGAIEACQKWESEGWSLAQQLCPRHSQG